MGVMSGLRLIYEGKALIDIPLTLGVLVAAVTISVAPVVATKSAIAALVTECTVQVQKEDIEAFAKK